MSAPFDVAAFLAEPARMAQVAAVSPRPPLAGPRSPCWHRRDEAPLR